MSVIKKQEKVICFTQQGKKMTVSKDRIILRTSAYGILRHQGKVLVLQAHLPLWEFPGGSIEVGETLRQCLLREFKEETGLVVSVGKLVLERESFYLSPSNKAYHSFQHFFEVEKQGGQLIKKSANRLGPGWMALKDLHQNNMNQAAFAALTASCKSKQNYQFL